MEFQSDMSLPFLTPELKAESEAACFAICKRYLELFPGRQCSAKIRNVLGGYIDIRVNMLKIGEKPPYGIDLNAPGHMSFMINLSDDFGRPLVAGAGFDVQGMAVAGIKFRKMRAGNPTEAAQKLMKWFEKNAEQIALLAK